MPSLLVPRQLAAETAPTKRTAPDFPAVFDDDPPRVAVFISVAADPTNPCGGAAVADEEEGADAADEAAAAPSATSQQEEQATQKLVAVLMKSKKLLQRKKNSRITNH